MSNQLKKITTRAKQIRKRKPGMKWTSAIKQAGAEYRKGSLGSATVSKPRKTKKVVRRKVAAARPVSRPAARKGPSSMMSGFRKEVERKLSEACLRYEKADTIKATKKAQADKNKYRKILKAL